MSGVARGLSRGKFSNRYSRKFRFTPKHAPKGYIKGFGSHKPGTMTTKAKFVSLDKRKFEIVAPPMDGVYLKPYVAHNYESTKVAPHTYEKVVRRAVEEWQSYQDGRA